MNSNIKVSVIVPVYNAEKTLKDCVVSICEQTLKEMEIILVDDGSSDFSDAICDELAKDDNRILVIHKENGGAGEARNTGIKHARGEYIGFVDADDYVGKNNFMNLYVTARLREFDACIGGCTEHSLKNIVEQKHCFAGRVFENKISIMEEYVPSIIGPDCNGENCGGASVWRGIYKSSLIKQFDIKFPSENDCFSEDTIFNIEFMRHADRIIVSDNVQYHYCQQKQSLSSLFRRNMFIGLKNLYSYEKTLCGWNSSFQERVRRAFVINIITCILLEASSEVRFKELRRDVKNYINDEDVSEAIHSIELKGMNLKQRIISVFVRAKFCSIIAMSCRLYVKILK